VFGDRSFVLLSTGDILDLSWSTSGATVAGTFRPGFVPDAIRVSDREDEYCCYVTDAGPLLVAWNASTYALWGLTSDAGSGPRAFPLDAGDAVIDVFTHDDDPPKLMALTDAGLLLYTAREKEGFVLADGGFDDYGPEWLAESLPTSFLDGGRYRPRHAWSFVRGVGGPSWIVFDAVSPDAPTQHRAVPFRVIIYSDRTNFIDQGYLDAPCRPGERLKAPFMRGGLTALYDPLLFQGDLEIRCEATFPDGGQVDRVVRNHCEPEDPSYFSFLCSIKEEDSPLPA
jgi:hypothetical protein